MQATKAAALTSLESNQWEVDETHLEAPQKDK